MIKTSHLGAVQETMMIPLLGRALETKKKNGILKDKKSVAIVDSLNYDFSRFYDKDSMRSMLRTTTRTVIIDRMVKSFIKDHPDATVIELGCGLNTRFSRVDNGRIRWFDLDMPDVFAVWQQFFEESDRKHFLPFSAFDSVWMEKVAATNPSTVLVISEASVIYFPEEQVKKLFIDLARHLPAQYYLFDSATSDFVDGFTKNDALKYFNVKFSWKLDDFSQLKTWNPGIELLKTVDLEIPSAEFSDLYSIFFKLKAQLIQLSGKAKTGQYQMNLVKM